jgi:ribose transport system permease protein
LVPTWRDRARTNRITLAVFATAVGLYCLSLIVVPQFTTFGHLAETLQLAGYLGIIAVGEGVVILGSGIDLSVASTASASGVLSASLASAHMASPLIILIVLALGAGMGLLNGLGVAYAEIPPLVMTLAMYTTVDGVILVATNGTPTSGCPPVFAAVSGDRFAGGLTGTVIVWFALAALAAFFLRRARAGRYLYALGTNPLAARLSGVPARLVTASTYVVAGLTAAIAGCLILGYTGAASTTAGDTYQLPAIAAVALGGANILGGQGTALGVALGAFTITVIQTLLTVVNVSEGIREVLEGALLLAVVIMYNFRNYHFRNARRRT